MDDRKMDHVITKIGDPVFVGTAGQSEQSFDHIEVRVELNKELSEEDFRSAYREALLSSYRKVPEMVSRNKEFLKYKIPTECLTVSNVTSTPDLRVLDYTLTIEEIKIENEESVDFIPADARKRSRDPDRPRPSSRPDRPRPLRRRPVTGD